MARFSFRLQKVLEFRELEEGEAKDAYLAARRSREEKLNEIAQLVEARQAVIALPADSLEKRRHLERLMERYGDEERMHRSALVILENEELQAQDEWHRRRQAVQALEKLRENALEAWRSEQDRLEQNELDEWTNLRRTA